MIGFAPVPSALSFFIDVRTEPDGTLRIDPPRSTPGAPFVVQAEMDLYVGLTACSAERSSGGVGKYTNYEIVPRDPRRKV